jgi:hypothetical protein
MPSYARLASCQFSYTGPASSVTTMVYSIDVEAYIAQRERDFHARYLRWARPWIAEAAGLSPGGLVTP